MSVEIQSQSFLYRVPVRGVKTPPFLHNYLHDVEGLWWIAMWSLFHTIPAARTHEVEGDLRKQLLQESTADDIFPTSLQGSPERRRFLNNKSYFDELSEDIPAEFRGVIPSLDKMAHLLVTFYATIQNDVAIKQINTPKPYTLIYGPIEKCFQDAIPHAAEDVRLISTVRWEAEKKEKEKEHAAAVLRGQKGDRKIGGKRTIEDAAGDPATESTSEPLQAGEKRRRLSSWGWNDWWTNCGRLLLLLCTNAQKS